MTSDITSGRTPQPPVDHVISGRLAHIGVIRFTGADALTFLQGQLSNDTRRLSASHTLLAAYSTPQGRVLALLRLMPHSSGILALLPREIVLPTIERLRKFVLRAKVQIEDVSDQILVCGQHGATALRAADLPIPGGGDIAAGSPEGDGAPPQPAAAAAPATAAEDSAVGRDHPASNTSRTSNAFTETHTYVEHGGIGIGRVSADADRYWVVGATADLAQCRLVDAGSDANGDALGAALEPDQHPTRDAERIEHAWRLADIRSGSPQIYAATREMFVAQMLNLDLIDGISFTKGCFTGQEIIARTQHLGRIKRRMFRLRLPAGTWAIGQAVHLRDGRNGRLIEVAQSAAAIEALAVLTLDPAAPTDGDSVAGTLIDAVELALPYALAQKT